MYLRNSLQITEAKKFPLQQREVRNNETEKENDKYRISTVDHDVLFFVMYAAGMVIFADKGFAKPQMFLNLFVSNAGLLVISCGLTIVMITGGIDISVGSVTALVCMVMADLMEKSGKISDKNAYVEGLIKREEESTTAVGEGIAIPHYKGSAVTKPGLAAMVIKKRY